MVTHSIFLGIVGAIALQRIRAIRLSKRNAAYLESVGGRQRSSNALWVVRAMQISWFVAAIAEVYLLNRPFLPVLAAGAIAVTGIGQLLRYLSMRELGYRWTHKAIVIPNEPVVTTGIYRYLRHPTWLGMTLEFAAVPLIHGAYFTAFFFSIANTLLMMKRLRAEEQALSEDTNYASAFADTSRLIPFIL